MEGNQKSYCPVLPPSEHHGWLALHAPRGPPSPLPFWFPLWFVLSVGIVLLPLLLVDEVLDVLLSVLPALPSLDEDSTKDEEDDCSADDPCEEEECHEDCWEEDSEDDSDEDSEESEEEDEDAGEEEDSEEALHAPIVSPWSKCPARADGGTSSVVPLWQITKRTMGAAWADGMRESKRLMGMGGIISTGRARCRVPGRWRRRC